MNYSLTWMPTVFSNAGLDYTLQDGWASRGRAEMGEVKGILCHHTAGPLQGDAPSIKTVTEGRPDLHGPLAQIVLGRSGHVYVIAAGRCNHAGEGMWQGITDGNAHFIGIEAENAGISADPWPDVQKIAYAKLCAAILTHIKAPVSMCVGHKEYAMPRGRKSDPSFDMGAFRLQVQGFIPQPWAGQGVR